MGVKYYGAFRKYYGPTVSVAAAAEKLTLSPEHELGNT